MFARWSRRRGPSEAESLPGKAVGHPPRRPFAPVLRAACGGRPDREPEEVEEFETVLDGRRFRVVLSGLDRAMMFAGCGAEPAGAMTLLRELAVLTPLTPAPALDRAAIQRTLDGLARAGDQPWQAAGWQGWRAHGGVLGPVPGAPWDQGTTH